MEINGFVAGYCDTMKKKVEPKTNWAKKILDSHREDLDWYTSECVERVPADMKYRLYNVMELYNQSGGEMIIHFTFHAELILQPGKEVN